MLGHPPVVLLGEVTDGDDPVARANGQFVLLGRPFDASRGSVGPQQDPGGRPLAAVGVVLGPDVGGLVGGAGDDAVGLGGPVDAHDTLVVLLQDLGDFPAGGLLFVDVNLIVVGAEGDPGVALVPDVTGDRVEAEIVDLGHSGSARGGFSWRRATSGPRLHFCRVVEKTTQRHCSGW